MQRAAQQSSQQQAVPNGVAGQPRPDVPGGGHPPVPLGNSPSQPPQVPPAGSVQARSHTPQGVIQNSIANGVMSGAQMGLQSIPQAPMQMNVQGQPRLPNQASTENLRIAMQQRAIQMSNQQFQLQQQQAQQHNLNQPGVAHVATQGGGIVPGLGTPNLNGASSASMGVSGPVGSSGSPRMAQLSIPQGGQPQTLSSGHIPAVSHISHQLQAQNPHLSPDQIRQLTNERLKGHLYQQTRQNALNAAAGASALGASNANGFAQNSQHPRQASPTQQYQQQMHQRVMQQRNQQTGSPAMNGQPAPSRSTTPQSNQMQRPGQ